MERTNDGTPSTAQSFTQKSEQPITEKVGKELEGDFATQSASRVAQFHGKVTNKISAGGRAFLKGLSKAKAGAKSLANKALPIVTRSNAHYRSRLSQEEKKEDHYTELVRKTQVEPSIVEKPEEEDHYIEFPPKTEEKKEDLYGAYGGLKSSSLEIKDIKKPEDAAKYRKTQEIWDGHSQIMEEIGQEVQRRSEVHAVLEDVSLGKTDSKTGFFGAVAKLRFDSLQKTFAFKVPQQGKPQPKGETKVVEYLANKSKIPGILRYRGILNLGFGQVIVAKWASEGDLKEYLNKVEDEKEKTQLLGLGARSLAAHHKEGVIHHDIKDSNFVVHKKKDETIEVYITDLGSASIRAENSRPEGSVNLLHSPPEITDPLRENSKADDWNNPAYDSWMLGLMIVQSLGNYKDEDLPWRNTKNEIIKLGPRIREMEEARKGEQTDEIFDQKEYNKLLSELDEKYKELSDLKSTLSWIDGIEMDPEIKKLVIQLMDPEPLNRPSLEYAADELERLSK